ncbi:MAG: hypothetical protein VX951_12255 [Planctomycetota bacterium]|nr:hypothetical protein [Planctomycetota bacterium]
MRAFLSLVLCLICVGCKSIERLVRNSPLSGVETGAGRVNVWPIYYQSGDKIAVLWPVFDDDERGFALRPLVTRDEGDWEVLWPLSRWNTETGDWNVLLAYRMDESYGVFPVIGFGDFSYVGPVWWNREDENKLTGAGLFPLAAWSEEFSHIGPVWWGSETSGDGSKSISSYGLFPIVDFGHGFNNIGPMFWGYDDDDEMNFAVAFPLFGFGEAEDGSGMLLSLLGGRGWDKNGETSFVNVLGPVFHYDREGESESTAVLWPLFWNSEWTTGNDRHTEWGSWPIFDHRVSRDEKGEKTMTETSAIAGLFRHAGKDGTVALRLLPLFSHRTKDGGYEAVLDWLSLYGHKEHDNGDTALHIGTPMVFEYRGGEGGYRWSSLLGTISYETEGDKSEFSLLYYLYRQKTSGTETRRDFFPFISWDSGEKRSGFSFLWRLFNWERNGDKVGGHIFFIPWGDR